MTHPFGYKITPSNRLRLRSTFLVEQQQNQVVKSIHINDTADQKHHKGLPHIRPNHLDDHQDLWENIASTEKKKTFSMDGLRVQLFLTRD